MANKNLNYPQSARDLANLLKNSDLMDSNLDNIKIQAIRILKRMNPKDLALYLAENPTCLTGLKLVTEHYQKQNEIYKAEFRKYIRKPQLLGLSD